MLNYLIRRLILLPITLFFIILVNFIIINLAPGEPISIAEVSPEGNPTRRQDQAAAFGDDRYLQFREFYGLTLPILFNSWPWISEETVSTRLWQLTHRKASPGSEEMGFKEYDDIRIKFGDQARFIMPFLMQTLNDTNVPLDIRLTASRFFSRGGSRQAILGSNLEESQKKYNQKTAQDNLLLRGVILLPTDSENEVKKKIEKMNVWFKENNIHNRFTPNFRQKLRIFFFETRFFRYISRVLTLDFGTLRNDANKTVISEVSKRFKYSLTLAILPMFITFFLCQIFGFTMALNHNRWPDYSLNVVFLALYAVPVFVVAPFLIEKVALNNTFPLTDLPIPISGFTSADRIYDQETSYQRLGDILRHICLPLIAVMYGSLAAESRLSRTAVLEVLRQDYVRTARAKGLPRKTILFKHIGRNAAITIVTSLAGSLGVVLGGSLIVETLFEINGFGKFFYDAVINRDYNVIMFSALAGSFLTLMGYLAADIAYTLLDPRLTLE